jgi:hypothetical protein
MISLKIHLKEVVTNLAKTVEKLNNKEYLLRPVAADAIAAITRRIHTDGIASDGNQIGEYSKGYMAVRTGIFKTNEPFKSGPRKGQPKPTGVFTKGIEKGKPRPQYHRSSETKIVASLTRQLENDYAIIATEKGYGVGFNNSLNFDKTQWVQATYNGRRIWDLTEAEIKAAYDRINQLAGDTLK